MKSDAPITIDDVQSLMSDLRAIALNLLSKEGSAHSVSPTALVMSGLRRYKVQDQDWSEITWDNRCHCFGSLHLMMQRALTDYARRRNAQRRPKLTYVEASDVDLYDLPRMLEEAPERWIALEEALCWLEKKDPELSQIIQCHYLSDMKLEELARWLNASTRTVKRRLAEGKLLLHRKILEFLNGPTTPALSQL